MLMLSTATPHVDYDRGAALRRFGFPPNPATERHALPLAALSEGKAVQVILGG
jgi:hypothetical protein